MKIIARIQITGYKKGSVIKNIDDRRGNIFYLPNIQETFESYNYDSKKKQLKEKTFLYIGSSDDELVNEVKGLMKPSPENDVDYYYICKDDVFMFNIETIIPLGMGDHNFDYEDSLIFDSINESYIFEDVELDKCKFSKMGTLCRSYSCLYQEDWYQCYEGDWDGNCFYVGVLDENGKLYTKSIERNENSKKEIEKYWTNWGEEYDPVRW